MSSTISPSERAYQLAHPNETSTSGLITYCIVGLCVIEVAVALRFWARKMQNIPWRSDDYTLLVAAVLAIGYCVTAVIDVQNGFGHHTLTISPHEFETRAKNGYANSLFYTTTFPISRISLVLLYKRVFVKEWLRYVCWFLIASYAGYSISTVFVDAFGVLPVAANWDKNITVAHTIDWKKLVFGNCVFNIITDLVLLVLPLTVIWILKMSKWARLGLSFVFSLGVLTLIASIMRCYYSFVYDKQDPDYSTGTGAFWTQTEVYLGLLCPCLVTFQPLLFRSYRNISSRLSPRNRDLLSRLAGDTPGGTPGDQSSNTGLKRRARDTSSSLHSIPSDIEAQTFTADDYKTPQPPLPVENMTNLSSSNGMHRDESGMAINQDVALANLDPRLQAKDPGNGSTMQSLGSSAQAGFDEEKRDGVPHQGIGVRREFELKSTRDRPWEMA